MPIAPKGGLPGLFEPAPPWHTVRLLLQEDARVSGTIFSGFYASGITLNNPSENPATVTGTVSVSSGAALTGAAGTAWTLGNSGTLIGSNYSYAVYLASGGIITNATTASLIQGGGGISIAGAAGTVVNAGTITGFSRSVLLADGGAVTNATSGTIGSVEISAAAGAVFNAGQMSYARLFAGGTITNAGAATFVQISGAAGGVLNTGTLNQASAFPTQNAVDLALGGYAGNGAGATITSGSDGIVVNGGLGTVVNRGTIAVSQTNASYGTGNYVHAHAVTLGSGGFVTNAASAVITAGGTFHEFAAGFYPALVAGIDIAGAPGTVTNAGTILASGSWINGFSRTYGVGEGIALGAGGSVSNSGGITALTAIDIAGTGSVFNTGQLLGTGAYGVSLRGAGAVFNETGGGITGFFDGVRAVNATDTVVNSATISGTQNYAVRVSANSTIINNTNALLTGGNDGVLFDGTSAVLINAGLISGAGTYRTFQGSGAYLSGGGRVVNPASGTIAGRLNGVVMDGSLHGFIIATGGAIDNAGTIIGTASYGIRLAAGGSVHNTGDVTGGRDGIIVAGDTADIAATLVNLGTIEGATGILAVDTRGTASNTIENAGLIDGTGGTAVSFGAGNDLLRLDPGAAFGGIVNGGAGSNTIELAAGTFSIAGIGTTITNFSDITFDPGAAWTVAGNTAGLAGVIAGFAAGDTLDITGVTESYATLAGGLLTLSGGTTLDLPGLAHASVTASAGNTYITACFATGTNIQTARGPVAVETLRPGDRLLTASGRLAPIRWIGHRVTDLARHPRPHDIMPVRVRAGALGTNLPLRDLVLSPDHALLLDSHLVPVRHLINGASIVQETRATITYWHVELDRHDIVLAEGVAAESYLDTGNRSAFAGEAALALHPDFAASLARAIWENAGCAPILTDPAAPALRARHTRLLARARRAA